MWYDPFMPGEMEPKFYFLQGDVLALDLNFPPQRLPFALLAYCHLSLGFLSFFLLILTFLHFIYFVCGEGRVQVRKLLVGILTSGFQRLESNR